MQKFVPMTLLFTLMGCASWDPDPTMTGEVSRLPGKPWVPCENPWYCKDKLLPKTEALQLPKIDEESDIGELIDLALMNHEVTQDAWFQARSAAFAYQAEQSLLYPSIDWVGSLYALDQSNPLAVVAGLGGTIKTESIKSNTLISYLLLDFGGRSASIEAYKRALDAVNWTQNQTIQQVIVNIMQSYYDYVGAKELSKARDSDLKNAELNLQAAEALYNAGVGTKLDYLQASASFENANLSAIEAANAIKVFLGKLVIGLGLAPETYIEIKNLPDQFPTDDIEFNLEDLLQKAS